MWLYNLYTPKKIDKCKSTWLKKLVFVYCLFQKSWICFCLLFILEIPDSTTRKSVVGSIKVVVKRNFEVIYSYGLGFAIVITGYPPSCLGQKIAQRPFGLRVKLPICLP